MPNKTSEEQGYLAPLQKIQDNILPGAWKFDHSIADKKYSPRTSENFYTNGPLTLVISKHAFLEHSSYTIRFYVKQNKDTYLIHYDIIYPWSIFLGNNYERGYVFKNDAEANLKALGGMRKVNPKWFEQNKEQIEESWSQIWKKHSEEPEIHGWQKLGTYKKEGGSILTKRILEKLNHKYSFKDLFKK